MKRLTSNKPVSEMCTYELAYNSCYAKDGSARVRDFKNDFDAKELTIKLLEKYADIPNEFTCDDDFEDFMFDSLQYGTDSILGLISVFYQNLWVMANLREWLKEYEDLEEQGKLLKLPCEVGDMVYEVSDVGVRKHKVVCIYLDEYNVPKLDLGWHCTILDNFGKTVFLAREEAEAALKQTERGKGK